MRLTLTKVLTDLKQNWTQELEPASIEQICRKHGVTWRRRVLNPARTIQLFVLQILHGNTACTHLNHLSQLSFSASAYCQARARLPLGIFQELLAKTVSNKASQDSSWFGHRVFIVDGSSFSMPDTPELQKQFRQPSGQLQGCGFPVAHMLALVDAGTGMIQQVIASTHRIHDVNKVSELHPEMNANDILLADRGFASFSHISLLLQRKVHSVMRMHQAVIVNFRAGRSMKHKGKHQKGLPSSKWLKKLGVKDQLVEWYKPKRRNNWISPAQFLKLPHSITVRELSYQITEPGFRTKRVVLVTTLLCPEKYPAQEIAKLYGLRWSIETDFKHLKTTMGMDVLKCKTVEGILKELYVYALVYNCVRLVMLQAAKKQNVPIKTISFIDALRWCCSAIYHEIPMRILTNPFRPNRIEPRAIKRRPKQYSRLRIPRQKAIHSLKYQ